MLLPRTPFCWVGKHNGIYKVIVGIQSQELHVAGGSPLLNKLNWDNFFPKALKVSTKNTVILRQTGGEALTENKYTNI